MQTRNNRRLLFPFQSFLQAKISFQGTRGLAQVKEKVQEKASFSPPVIQIKPQNRKWAYDPTLNESDLY